MGRDGDVGSRGDARLSIPPLPSRLVTRPRLLEALEGAVPATALSLVTAKPGGGKSVLLSQWARSCGRPTAWIALTTADNDPVRFWSLFLAAAGVAHRRSPPTAWGGGAAPGMLDVLLSRERPQHAQVVVVLDDAHLLREPEVLSGLDRLVRRWSHRVRLVLAARSVPLLPVHQYRLTGQLHELRDSDLAMTRAEAEELLLAHDVRLTGAQTAALVERTEGWTGGLRLAAQRMEGAPRPAEVVAGLAVDRGSIGEYLIEEVLSVLPARTRRLLIQTSSLDVVTAAGAEAITGIAGCGPVLADLARTNAFVIPLDSSFTAFRYHELMREVLRYLARAQPPRTTRETHRRAVAWFLDQDDVRSALHWAMNSGDPALARRLLARGGLARAVALRQDLGDLRLDGVLDPPRTPTGDEAAELETSRVAVAAIRAAGGTHRGRDRFEDAPGDGPSSGDPELRVTCDVADVLLAHDAGDSARLDRAVARLAADDLRAEVARATGLRAALLLIQARALVLDGRPTEADDTFARALAAAEQERAPAVLLDVLAGQALVSARAGRPRRMEAALAHASSLRAERPDLEPPVELDLARAWRCYLEADLGRMAHLLHRTQEAGPVATAPEAAGWAALLNAFLLTASDELAPARDWLRAMRAGPPTGLQAALRDGELAAIELRLGRPRRALSLVLPHGSGPHAAEVAVPAARAHLALGDPAGAERTVRPLVVDPRQDVARPVLVELLLCRAQIALHGREETRALEYVDRAITAADPDVVMPFAKAHAGFAALLARHAGTAGRWPAAQPGVRRDPGGDPAVRVPAARSSSPDERLTERERAVLRLLTTSTSVAEMASELVLSVNTVKTHLAAVYRKLGVHGRREAVSRARDLEIL
jgi:LuxR family maltose regulon positive regulatory protein